MQRRAGFFFKGRAASGSGMGQRLAQSLDLDQALAGGHVPSDLVAQSGHDERAEPCPLLGVKRTSRKHPRMSANDPKRTLTLPKLISCISP
jgi:hypothetical protein